MTFRTNVFTALAISLALASPLSAGEVILGCQQGNTYLNEIELRGTARTFRSFYVDPIAADKPIASYVLLHCPTGQYVEVSGFVPFEFMSNPVRPVTADDVKRGDAVREVTNRLFELKELTLSDAPALYEAEGLTATYRTGMTASCACTEY